jgi:hypothetical protein
MTYWIIAHLTVQHVTISVLTNPAVEEAMESFDTAVNQRLDDENHINAEFGVFYFDDEEADDEVPLPDPNIPTDDKYGDMIIEPRPDVDSKTYD